MSAMTWLTAGAGLVHLGVAIAHRNESPWHVAAFAVAGVVQLVLAGVRRGGSPRLTVLVNGSMVVAWLLSHVASVGPFAGHQGVATAGAITVGLELGAIVLAVRPVAVPRLAVAGLTLVAGFGTVTAAAADVEHDHGEHAHGQAADHAGGHAAGHGHDGHGAGEDHAAVHGSHATAPTALAGVTFVATGEHPEGITADADAVYVANRSAGTITRIPVAGGAPDTFTVGGAPTATAVAGGVLWITDFDANTVIRVDPRTGSRTGADIPVGSRPVDVLADGSVVFVANSADGTVTRVDTATGAASTSDRAGYGLTSLATAGGRLYALATLDSAVVALDPATLAPVGAPIRVGHGALSLTADGTGVFVANTSDGTVSRIDTTVGDVVGSPVTVDPEATPGYGPVDVVTGTGRVFVIANRDRSVLELDPATRTPAGLGGSWDRTGSSFRGLNSGVVAGGSLWITDYAGDRVVRIRL